MGWTLRGSAVGTRLASLIGLPGAGQTGVAADGTLSSAAFVAEITDYLETETAAHVSAIHSIDPPQPTIFGAPTHGSFSWATLMRTIADVSDLRGRGTIGDRDVPELLGRLGVIEAKLGGKTFAQLAGALTLRQFGVDLPANALWRTLTPGEQAAWRSLLDPGRFYDRQKRQVVHLPDTYYGVAARIAALAFQVGLIDDRSYVDDVLDCAAEQFLRGAIHTDDAVPHGRYDRYSQEFARYVYEAALDAVREDIAERLEPALQALLRAWWDLVAPDGYAYPWGRTIGAISYSDTLAIIGHAAQHPRLRPAPLADLASVFHAALRSLQREYQPDRHLLNMFDFGRGNYRYMSPDRLWQQTTSYLGKAAASLLPLAAALEAERVTSFPATPPLPAVARFEWFRRAERPAGVWLVRQGPLRFALPFTSGPRVGISDYLAAPHGLPGFAAPVEQLMPALVPYLELDDGRTVVASDGADEIEPSTDGASVRAAWNRLGVVGDPPSKRADLGLRSAVTWSIDGDTLVRDETISATRRVSIRQYRVTLPSTAQSAHTRFEAGRRIDRFESDDGTLEVSLSDASFALEISLEATGNSAFGRGARRPIPLLLHLRAADLTLKPGETLRWTIRLRAIGR